MTACNPPPITDELPISLRAFACPVTGPSKRYVDSAPRLGASCWTLIFDCETTSDDAQRLRFGTYQVRESGDLIEEGIFFDPASVSPSERRTLRRYAKSKGLQLLTSDEFVDRIFYGVGYRLRATIVGFNLPFDISRIAIESSSARGSMRGGFSFELSADKRWPRLQVKHLSSKASIIRFAAPFKQRSNRSMQKKGRKEAVQRGYFVDVKTLAFALFARPFSLAKLCDFLGVENPKKEFKDFERSISTEMIDYAVRDTQATWECFEKLSARYAALGLNETSQERIYSEASVGKACLKAMGIVPWRERQPDFDPRLIGTTMSGYFGGRSEIGIRRELRQVMLCDFLSMYPTVCTLMRLWRFVIATGIKSRDATDEARALLESVSLEELQSKSVWQNLVMLVRAKPDADIFPVRAHYNHADQATIGLNHLTHDGSLWFTLADCIASKLLTGKSPEIIQAITFAPKRKQNALRKIRINGNDDYAIDPAKDDFYKRLIELRHEIKSKITPGDSPANRRLKTEQNTLKIWANSTSYGIFVELNVEDASSKAEVLVHHSGDEPYRKKPSKIEKPGTYFHPLLATLITGAARLMLSITERLAVENGLEWSFCDTDSMALARPEPMGQDEFAARVQYIIDWFSGLNPYAFGGSILKSESVNYSLDDPQELVPLYCWAVSAKRYVLFNLTGEGKPVLRKASAHGLGHLRAPYDEENPAPDIAKPRDALVNIGVELWQHDLWVKVVEAALAGKPNQVNLTYHPNLQLPAISRYAATSPHLLKWFDDHNKGRSYADRVKPFGFLTTLSMKRVNETPTILENPHKRHPSSNPTKPVSPYADDPEVAARNAFDRNGGGAIPRERLQSYAQSLAQYHLHPENKFLNGNWLDRGPTERRHVKGGAIQNIGKEANEWEKQVMLGFDRDAQPTFGLSPSDILGLQQSLAHLLPTFSKTAMAEFAQLTPVQIERFLSADCRSAFAIELAPKMLKLAQHFRRRAATERSELKALRRRVEEIGLRPAAREIGCDPSNLNRRLKV